MLATLLDRDPFLGRILTGRIESGKLTVNMPIKALDVNGDVVEEGRATKVFAFRGLERVAVDSAEAGEIVAIAGLIKATVSNTFADPSVQAPLHARPIDPPTLAMSFSVNDSPFAGGRRQGAKPRHPRTARARGRGQCRDPRHHLGRQRQLRSRRPRRAPTRRSDRDPAPRRLRARYQPPARALPRWPADGREEPYETVVVDVDDEFSGTVIDKMAMRKAEMTDMRPRAAARRA